MQDDLEAAMHQAAREAWEKSLHEEIRVAVLMTQGEREIVDIQEKDTQILPGARRFMVESFHIRQNGRSCVHFDHVYYYRDHYVVLSQNDLLTGKLAQVPHLLMEASDD